MKRWPLVIAVLLVSTAQQAQQAAEPVEIRIDCGRTEGAFRALHGSNKAPLDLGEQLDLTEAQKELGIPLTRLHDCHWPTEI